MKDSKPLDRALVPLEQRSSLVRAPMHTHPIPTSCAPPARTCTDDEVIDVCAELFRFCKHCDEKYLQPRKIQCLFDVDSGPMHRGALQILCEVIDTLLADIAQYGSGRNNAASVTVRLRKKHGVWILALAERRIEAPKPAASVRRLSLVRRRAQLLGGACRVHRTADGYITALMFDCGAVAGEWHSHVSMAIH